MKIDGTTYVEGATVDTVGFWDLLQNHPDLDEVWVCRILTGIRSIRITIWSRRSTIW